MLPTDTIFTRLPAELDRVELRFLDAIRFGIESADLSYRRLCAHLLEVTRLDQVKGELPKGIFTATISDAWAVVDTMHRLKELLERTPRLKQKAPEVALFIRDAEVLNDLRNSFHHAREDFLKMPPNETAIWGVVSWCVPAKDHVKIFSLVPGTVFEGGYPALDPRGHIVVGPLDLVTLTAFTKKAELSGIYRKMARLAAHLEAAVAKRVTGMGGSMCDMCYAIDMHNVDEAPMKA